MDNTAIVQLAVAMRAAIEAIPISTLPDCMKNFPQGCCGDTSLLLGAYLVDCGHEGFEYVCGERGSRADDTWTSHAWLVRDGLIVDITADQFSDAPRGVVVNAESVWHEQFAVTSKSVSDFRLWHGPGTHHLRSMYSELKPILLKGATQPGSLTLRSSELPSATAELKCWASMTPPHQAQRTERSNSRPLLTTQR